MNVMKGQSLWDSGMRWEGEIERPMTACCKVGLRFWPWAYCVLYWSVRFNVKLLKNSVVEMILSETGFQKKNTQKQPPSTELSNTVQGGRRKVLEHNVFHFLLSPFCSPSVFRQHRATLNAVNNTFCFSSEGIREWFCIHSCPVSARNCQQR